ncbi:MAG: ATP-binding protein [Firmicutes bacterium]|nr:ATP-binding protein [Bacillota bacterium]
MLLNSFKVSGFKVFGKPVELNMVPKTKNYQTLDENVIVSLSKKNLKSALLYGGNNTGKSSLLDAFLVFKKLISTGNLDDFPFDLYKNFCYFEDDVIFEISFLHNHDDITYGVEFNESKDLGEYVFIGEELIFSRERDHSIEGKLIDSNLKIKERIEDLPLDKLVLSYMNEYVSNPGTDVFMNVKKFFDQIEYINDSNKNMIMSKEIMEFSTNNTKMRILNHLIESTELFIDKRELAEEGYVVENEYYNKHIPKDAFARIKTMKSQSEGLRMVSYYQNELGESVAKPSILFDSIGTNKFIVLSMSIINAILNNKILLIDEIDSSLHYKLTRALVILMNSDVNHQSQFIMSTHDVKLLSPKLFRKDQVNFVIRNKEAVSIVSLDDFKANSLKDIRSDSNFEKMYVEERIVDLPDTNISNVIKEMRALWEKKT